MLLLFCEISVFMGCRGQNILKYNLITLIYILFFDSPLPC